jgi:cation diffusion facilitator family transporter
MTIEKRATVVASVTSFLLIIMKVTIGVVSGSVAVLASAVDSVLDLVMSLFNMFAVNESEKPADDRFNYGRGKVEALAAVIEGTIITMSGLFILYASIDKFFSGESTSYLDVSIIVMLVSLVITVALVFYLERVAKKSNSLVIKSDALHYKTDIYTNGVIVLSLVLVALTGYEAIDAIMGALISIYIIYAAYGIIQEGTMMLLDAALDEETVEQIKAIIQEEKEVEDFHYLRTRRSGKTNIVDCHIVFNTKISLLRAHASSDNIEEKIVALDGDQDWLINLHLDPYDDSIEHH